MRYEVDVIHANKTWDLVPHPPNVNIVGSKWVYRTKYLSDDSIDRYKARLVALGFTQITGFDISHSFSPVVKAAIVRIILNLDIQLDWPLHHFDIKNVFLHNDLTKFTWLNHWD